MNPPRHRALQAIADKIEHHCGLVVPQHRFPLLVAELDQMDERRAAGAIERIRRNETGLLSAIANRMVIDESYFFRHSGHFSELRRLAEQRKAAGLGFRVLSAGSAKGEEAWSAAAVLQSVYGEDELPISVTGWDLSPIAVRRAKLGEYSSWSARKGLRAYSRFFETDPDRVTVGKALRRHVRFQTRNLATPDSFDGYDGVFDAVFFRNVSIYWKTELSEVVMTRLLNTVATNGTFFGGPSDPVRPPQGDWDSEVIDGSPVFTRANPSRTAKRSQGTRAKKLRVRQSPRLVPAPEPPPVVAPPTPRSPLERVKAMADAGDYLGARAVLDAHQDEIERHEMSLWCGVLTLNQGDINTAVGQFRQAVYLQPDRPDYRRWFAVALEAAGQPRAAARERRNASNEERE